MRLASAPHLGFGAQRLELEADAGRVGHAGHDLGRLLHELTHVAGSAHHVDAARAQALQVEADDGRLRGGAEALGSGAGGRLGLRPLDERLGVA